MCKSLSEGVKGPVFIVGCPRSGTSMLVRSLSLHKQINIIRGESSFYEQVYGNRALLGKVTSNKAQARLKRYLFWKKNQKTEWRKLQFDRWMENFHKIPGRSYLDLYTSLMLTFADMYRQNDSNLYYIGDKNPSDVYYMKELKGHFPNINVINVIRDARAVVSSLLKSTFGHNDLMVASLTWKHHIQTGIRLEKHLTPKSYFQIPYEQIVCSPAKALRDICRFLAIAFEKQMVSANLSGLSSYSTNIDEQSFDPTRILRYRDALTLNQIGLIEHMTREEMTYTGYLSEEHYSPNSISKRLNTLIQYKNIKLVLKQRMKHLCIRLGILGIFTRPLWI